MRRAQGHKASFCLEDTECDPGFEKKWNCTRGGDQGLSPGCFDIYSSKIDCQWVDCTGISGGSFYLRVQLNPGNQVAESDFKNNVAKCTVYDYRRFIIADKCWIGKLYVIIITAKWNTVELRFNLGPPCLVLRIRKTRFTPLDSCYEYKLTAV